MKAHERMRNYILENHLKQSSIAQEMGLLPSTFSMILNGERRLTADELGDFCKSVKQSPEVFLDYSEGA